MKKVSNLIELKENASKAIKKSLDYIAQNPIYSVWTSKKTGWQETWNKRGYSGLYGICNVIPMLLLYKEEYSEVIGSAVEELGYTFDFSIDYTVRGEDTSAEKKRKERCRLLLEQNEHTTLKAVYAYRTYLKLIEDGVCCPDDEQIIKIQEQLKSQIKKTYIESTGLFMPALNNTTDNSILTTKQAFCLMPQIYGEGSAEFVKTKNQLVLYMQKYIDDNKNREIYSLSKFIRYERKSNAVSALWALSQNVIYLSEEEKKNLIEGALLILNDDEIRHGYQIKDSFSVPDTTIQSDTYMVDARLLFIWSLLNLIDAKLLTFSYLECILEDIIEIIDTIEEISVYSNWDKSPSLSHCIRAIKVLDLLIRCIEKKSLETNIIKIDSKAFNTDYHYVDSQSVVLFMPFSNKYYKDLYLTCEEILSQIGLKLWCASNVAYDISVVDSIWNKLQQAQFVIIDCTDKRVNVMYEAGLAHGLGKNVFLCGSSKETYSDKYKDRFEIHYFNSNGVENNPPFRDLQKEIAMYILKNINKFCLPYWREKDIHERIYEFAKEYDIVLE